MARLLAALPIALAALPACGDQAATPDAGHNCDLDERGEEFLAGMARTGEAGLTFRIVSSDPAPPARGDNTWVLDLTDVGGAPLEDAAVTVTPFMPDHRHGTPIPAVVEPDPAVPGRYHAEPVNLWMPGLWEITLRATPDGGGAAERDQVIFRFCIPG
jgi:hypothetical protein